MKRIIISDDEKNTIRQMHESFKENGRVVNEQKSNCVGKVGALITQSGEKYPGTFTTEMVKGKVVLKTKNQALTKGMIVKNTDELEMTDGSEVTFKDIKAYGKGYFTCENNTIKYGVYYN